MNDKNGFCLLGMQVVIFLVFLASGTPGARAFTSPHIGRSEKGVSSPIRNVGLFGVEPANLSSWRRRSGLSAGFLDDIGKFFEDMGKSNSGENDDAKSDDEDSEFYGSTRVLTIPVDSLKIGGLRLYLSLYLMGQQNTPDKGSWRANQVGDSGIDVYYHDRTGALMIDLSEDSMCIKIDRLGSSPSMQYLMQESAILGGLLDELDSIASDEAIDEPNRLIQLAAPGDAIENARETLSFS